MALPKPDTISEQEYLALELDYDIRHEYVNGQIFAMAGASPNHNRVTRNTLISIGNQIMDKDCEIFPSDMRVQVSVKREHIYRYPDMSIVCGRPQFADTNPKSLLNPVVLIEVLSESTTNTDRVAKFEEYRRISSLREYVLISTDSSRIERYLKQDDINWLYTDLAGIEQQIELPSIGCMLVFSAVFRRVEFDTNVE